MSSTIMPTSSTNTETTVSTNTDTTDSTNTETTDSTNPEIPVSTSSPIAEQDSSDQVPLIYDFYNKVLSGTSILLWLVTCIVTNPVMDGDSNYYRQVFSLLVEAISHEEAREKGARLFSEDDNFCHELRQCSYCIEPIFNDIDDSTAVYELLVSRDHCSELRLMVTPFAGPGIVHSLNDWNSFRERKQWENSYYENCTPDDCV